jgi:hypothetical protein
MEISYEALQNYKVKLLKNFVDSQGNLFSPKVYNPSELSRFAYKEGLVIPVEEIPIESKEEKDLTIDPYGNIAKEKSRRIEPQKPKTQYVEVKEQEVLPVEESEVSVQPKDVSREVNVNTSTSFQIQTLKGIGKSTADRVVTLRESSPFIDYLDLNERVELAFGRKWEDFPVQF